MGFDAEKDTLKVIEWIKKYFDDQPNAKGAVIGLSGGKDSAVCAGLLVKAIGKKRVLGVSLPNGVQSDIADAEKVAKHLDIEYMVINISGAFDALYTELNPKDNLSNQAKINMAPRLRMTALYALSANRHYRVCGTGNASEAFVGYFTKFGDGGYDFNPIANFTTDEVIAIGDYLELPTEIVHKTPSDGISGLSDEENLGITYANINRVIKGDIENVPMTVFNQIIDKHEYNKHKLVMPKVYIPERTSGKVETVKVTK